MALARLSSGLNNPGTGSPATITYTNSAACVIVLNIVTQSGSGGFSPISGVTDSAGVTWHRRSSKAYVSAFTSSVSTGVNNLVQEVWWANLTAVHASAVTVSVAISNTANQATGTLLEWVTVTGSLTPNAPWDVNAALPGIATYSNAGGIDTVPSAPWAVSSASAMVLSFLHQMTPPGTINVSTPGTGYADTGAAQTIGLSSTGVIQAAISWIFGQSGSGTTTWVGGGAGGTGTREWILFTDALTSDATGSSLDTSPLAIAGTPAVTSGQAGTTVSTTYSVPANSLVIAAITTYGFTGTGFCPVSGVSDTGGLTWHRRRQTQFHTPYAGAGTSNGLVFVTQEIWWAFASAAQTSQSITAALSNTAVNQGTGSDMIVFGVSGVRNPAAPWDDNASLSALQTFGSASATQAINPTGTTSQANSMILGFLQAYTSSLDANPPTIGTGFTSVATNTRGSSPNQFFVGVEQELQAVAGATAAPWANSEQSYVAVLDALSGTATGSSADNTPGTGPSGTIATALSKISQSASGTVSARGTITTSLSKISQLAQAPGNASGTIRMALRPTSQRVTAQEIFVGSATTNLKGVSSNQPQAQEVFVAQIVTRLSRASFGLVGQEKFVGQVVTRLGSVTGQIVANEIQGLEIIQGPIIMNLTRFNATILGAKLGTPGGGKWYSYRYLDS